MTPEERFVASSMHQPVQHSQEWDGLTERRRHTRGELFDLLAQLHEQQQRQADKLDSHIMASTEWRESVTANITGVNSIVSGILDGFPNQDPRGHHDYHVLMIENAKLRKELMQAALKKLTEAGLIAFVFWIGKLGWEAFLKGPK